MPAPESVPAKPVHPYGTYMEDRNPEWKTHSILAHAKNALTNKVYGGKFEYDYVIYELVGDVYLPFIKVSAGTTREDYPALATKPPKKSQLQLELEFAKMRVVSSERAAMEARRKYAATLMETGVVKILVADPEEPSGDVVEIVGAHVKLGATNSGHGLQGKCFFCAGSMHVAPDKGVWYCFKCGRGGTGADFLKMLSE